MSTKHFMRIDSSETLLVTRICANASGEGLSKSAEISIRVQNDLDELLTAWIYGAAAVRGVDRNFRLIFVVCEECRHIKACQFCFCEGRDDETVVFLTVGPHDRAYAIR